MAASDLSPLPVAAPGEGRHPEDDGRPLVAFDFDGTLTVRDSFVAFLRWHTRGWRALLGWARLAPAALAYLARRDRGRLKSAAVAALLQGVSREELARQAQAFASASFDALMRPDALKTWGAHKAAGARMVIVTASPEEIVAPFAERLGADALLGSRLAWTAKDRVGSGLAGANCRGPEKVVRLIARFGERGRPSVAYGDTAGDREMLAFAERGELGVFTGRP